MRYLTQITSIEIESGELFRVGERDADLHEVSGGGRVSGCPPGKPWSQVLTLYAGGVGELGQSVDAVVVRGKGRRRQVLDTAVDLLGSGGERAMAFHSVDDVAGIPRGSTSNHFRTRELLLVGVCAEVLTRRARIFIASAWPNGLGNALTEGELVESLSGYVLDATDPSMTPTGVVVRAHLSLVVLAQWHPELEQMLTASDQRLQYVLHSARCVIHPAALQWHTEMITDYLAGVVTSQIGAPREKFNPRPAIAALLAACP